MQQVQKFQTRFFKEIKKIKIRKYNKLTFIVYHFCVKGMMCLSLNVKMVY